MAQTFASVSQSPAAAPLLRQHQRKVQRPYDASEEATEKTTQYSTIELYSRPCDKDFDKRGCQGHEAVTRSRRGRTHEDDRGMALVTPFRKFISYLIGR